MKDVWVKRISLLLLAAVPLLLLAACGESPHPPAATTPAPVEGTTFSDQELGISFVYPLDWTLVTQDTLSEPAFAELMQENFGMGIEEVKDALLQAPVIFYDMARTTGAFINNANMVVVDSPGVTQAAMRKLTDAQLEENLLPQLDDVGVAWVETPTMKESNGISYFACSYIHTLVGAPSIVYQATTGENGKMYTFTYSAAGEAIEPDALLGLQQVIDTIKFLT